MAYSTTTYPYDCVCYIVTEINGSFYQGSGVIIGPHTILTASHLLWNQDVGKSADYIQVYPEYSSGPIVPAIDSKWITHFNQINDSRDLITQAASQSDYAIIDFATNLSSYGAFGVETGYGGGTVHVTGYPAAAGGAQTDQVGTVSLDPFYSVLDYGTVSVSPGNSGGPLWVNLGTASNPLPYVVGVVSTDGYAVQLTAADFATIQGWEAADSSLWLPVANVQNVSVAANASIPGSSMISSVSNPGGDSVTAYEFFDSGSGGGHFVLNGVIQPANTVIEVLTGNLSSIQYVGGATSGSETLKIAVYDYTTNSYSNYTSLTAATTLYSITAPLMTNTTGALRYDQVVGGQMAYTQIGGIGAEWELAGAGVGLLNGDGKPAFVMRNTGNFANGQLDIGEVVNGSAVFTGIGGVGPEWQFAGVDNFLGHGRADFLMRNTGNFANGQLDIGEVVNGSAVFTPIGGVGPEWQFAGTGDFLGDGRTGFLMRNTGSVANGQIDVGEVVNGAAVFTLLCGVGPEWEIKGVGDYLGVGHPGFLMRNTGTVTPGRLMVGERVNSSFTFSDIGAVGPEWEFVGSGRYLSTASDDFLIRNTGSVANGQLEVGAISNGKAGFTVVGAVGPEWNFHTANVAVLP
jgi:V8-like Glu-specific endopeptidase